jgi:hypothetical protein
MSNFTVNKSCESVQSSNVCNTDEMFPVVATATSSDKEIFLKDLKYPYKGHARIGDRTVY